MIDPNDDGNVVAMATLNQDYRARLARLLSTSRVRAGLPVEEMAALVSIRAAFPVALEPARLEAWEAGDGFPVPAAVMLAAFEIAGVESAVELEGLVPDTETLSRLEGVLAEMRELLNDPAALMRRARRLLGGRVSVA